MNAPSTESLSLTVEAGSFRDRHSRVYIGNNAVYRGISDRALSDWKQLTQTKFFPQAINQGKVVYTEQVAPEQVAAFPSMKEWAAILKHQRIPFISYPYEWCFGMLKDAALLQLELIEDALREDMTMKDASSFNFQWLGAHPVFIDVASFEKLSPGSPWAGYRQFCEMFLYPLMLQAYKNISFQSWLRGNIEGIDPVEFRKLFTARDIFRAGILMDVIAQAKLQSKYAETTRKVKDDIQRSGFRKEMIIANVRRLRKIVAGMEWKQSKSTWSDYATDNSYTDADGKRKAQFVREVVQEKHRDLVWDLGCNTGAYSRIASENAAYVLAMDSDQLAIERLYQELRSEKNESILPLVVNLANSSPALGWRGLERKTLPERGKPDLVLALALIHHVVISANIPLDEFIDWLATLGGDLVIEFVSKQDPMTQRLLKNKEDQYDEYTLVHFEESLQRHFQIVRRDNLASGTRYLFYTNPLSKR